MADDTRRWGVMEDRPEGRVFRPIPRGPMELAGLGPPPFTLTRETDGVVLHIVEEPDAEGECTAPPT
jgi:hypothetical protein